jgi:putative transposase
MKFAFIAKHRAVWLVAWMCTALSVSRSGFHAWLTRQPSQRTQEDEAILVKARASFVASDRTTAQGVSGATCWQKASHAG